MLPELSSEFVTSEDISVTVFLPTLLLELLILLVSTGELLTEFCPLVTEVLSTEVPTLEPTLEDLSPEVLSPEDLSPEVLSPEDLSPEVLSLSSELGSFTESLSSVERYFRF